MEQPQSSSTQQITPTDQLVHPSNQVSIGSCALTTIADILTIYIQQFWRTVRKVPNANESIRFMMDKKDIIYTIDMFCATLKLLVEIPEQPFIPPADFDYIWPFLKILGYQGPLDRYTRLTKLIIADLIEKYESFPKRLEEEYPTIKDDTLLVNMYTTGEVTVRGMQIPNDLLTDAIKDTHAYKDCMEVYDGVEAPMIQPESVESTHGTHRTLRATRIPNPTVVQKKRKGKQIVGESSTPNTSLKIRIKQKKSNLTFLFL
ncbi:hypothetical protein Tco_0715428 [Tanacetum coccineum]